MPTVVATDISVPHLVMLKFVLPSNGTNVAQSRQADRESWS